MVQKKRFLQNTTSTTPELKDFSTKDTWKPLIGRKHVSIPMNAFNEWVSTEQGKKIVQFSIKEQSLFWVAGLFDIWENPDTKISLFHLL